MMPYVLHYSAATPGISTLNWLNVYSFSGSETFPSTTEILTHETSAQKR